MQVELWNEKRLLNQYEIIGGILREEFLKEKIERINLSYLSPIIDNWWSENTSRESIDSLVPVLYREILDNLKPEHLSTIQNIGRHKISAVFLEYIFSIADKDLAKLVHEAVARLSGIVDIKYPYEEHKELFPKASDTLNSDWGKGLGIIRPHSDDIYEERDINVMSLTVCKDTSSTPTWFWPLKDVVACLTDEELGKLASSEATFYSGTNVEDIVLKTQKPILRRDSVEGLGLRLDFRIDDSVGPRMRFVDESIHPIVEKIRESFKVIKPISSNPSTGCISILSNFKVLHGRSSLNPVMLYEGESSRILFRSKGIK